MLIFFFDEFECVPPVGSPKKVTKHGLPKKTVARMCLGICPYQSILSRVEQQGTPQPGPHSPSFFSSSPCGTKSPANLQEFPKKMAATHVFFSRFSGKDMDEYLSEARNACHANELKLI